MEFCHVALCSGLSYCKGPPNSTVNDCYRERTRTVGYSPQSITFEASDRCRSLQLALIHFLASELSPAPICEIARY